MWKICRFQVLILNLRLELQCMEKHPEILHVAWFAAAAEGTLALPNIY